MTIADVNINGEAVEHGEHHHTDEQCLGCTMMETFKEAGVFFLSDVEDVFGRKGMTFKWTGVGWLLPNKAIFATLADVLHFVQRNIGYLDGDNIQIRIY
jgi:hypothetical protein